MKSDEMTIREHNKAANRRKILDAAKALMQEGGLEALSMRALAERASVSSRTPYNLFGSKTAVLIGLLDAPLAQLQSAAPSSGGVVLTLLDMLEPAYRAYEPELDYYRHIYWGIMSSDHAQARAGELARIRQMLEPVLALAIEVGELAEVDAQALAKHLVLLGLGLLGLWASNLINDLELLTHMRLALGQGLQAHASEALRAQIEATLAKPTGH